MATVSTYGELGTVTNWQQHSLGRLLAAPGRELAGMLGEPLPADAMPSAEYDGPPRLIVPVVRGELEAGEPLRVTVLILGGEPAGPALCWRPLGPGSFARLPLAHVARGVYSALLPAAEIKGDFEYHIEATVGGQKLLWPATAPAIHQAVVVE
jgi:hypothetical protein